MSNVRRVQRKGFFIGFAMIIALIASVAFSLTVFTAASDVGAHAETYTHHYASDTKVDASVEDDDTKTYIKFDQTEIDKSTKVDSYYESGDFYSSESFAGGNVSSDGKGFNYDRASGEPGTWYCDLEASENLKAAINDPFINVTISVYVVWAKPDTPDNSSETCNLSIIYVSDESSEDKGGESVAVSRTKSVDFNASTVGSVVSPSQLCSLTVPDMDMCDDGFLRLVFADWGTGIDFSIAWSSMYVEVTTEASSGSPELVFDSISVYDETGYRYRDTEKTNLVKTGDIVVMEIAAKKNGIPLALPKNKAVATTDGSGITDEDKKADGYFYARKYLAGSERSDTFIKYDFDAEKYFERLYTYDFPETGDFKYKGTLDISDDYSGQIVILRVKDSTAVTLPVYASTWRKNGVTTYGPVSTSLTMDNTKPNQPELGSDSVFYQKYVGISGKSFYTDEESYVYENRETVSGNGVLSKVITGVDLGKGTAKPLFSSKATTIEETGGSDIFIYAKSTRIDNFPVIGENSQGFNPTEEGSLYCRVYSDADGAMDYYSLVLDLVTKDSDGNDAFKTSGFYSIEFVAVDEAGNYNYCPNKQYVKVDVTDYKFNCQLILGLGTASSGVINMSDATPYFATIRDNGQIGDYVKYSSTDGISFKRGAKVVVKLKMSSSGFNNYILTNFKTGGSVNIATTDNVYANYATIITDSPKDYTFEVNATYSSDEKTREIRLVFKQRAYISVINTLQTYTGSGLKVKAIIKDGKGTSANTVAGTVKTTYSKTKDGEYTETLPVDKGIYYYKCELLNHNTYYATTENDGLEHIFEIQAATPQIEPKNVIAEEIRYGQSLAEIDFIEVTSGQKQDFNTHIKHAVSGKYYSDRSADGIIGYYTLAFTDKTAIGYVKPNAGTMTIAVKFVPIKANGGTPVRSGDGKFIRDENYKEVQFTIDVTVRRSTETTMTINGLDKDTGTITYDYDGENKSLDYQILSALSGEEYGSLLNEYAVVTYRKNVDGDEYTLISPVDAGNYKVKIALRSSCNYTVGELEYDFVIAKRKLNVLCYNVEYDYKKAEEITPIASYGTGSSKTDYPALNYTFGFYKYVQGETYASAATEENFIGNVVPQEAGRYVVKIELSENNFENANEAYALLTINKVGGNKVTLNAPTVRAVYGDSHIRFLQPLKAIVLVSSTSSGVRYSGESVKGSFIVSYRQFGSVGHEGETAEEFREDSEKYAFTETGRTSAYLCFIPSDGDENNFEVVSREIEIIVGKAKPVCTDMTVENIVYLTDIKSISDLTFNGKLKYLLYGTEYKSVDADDEDYGYTMEFYVAGTKKFNAGEHNLDIKIIPNGTQSDKIEEIVWSFNITVNKYDLILEADKNNYDEEQNAYVYKYGSVSVPSVSNDRNVSVRSEIAYYDKDNNVVDGTLLPTGSYKAVYTVINDDYQGALSFNIIVEKADLRSNTLPKIYNENTAVSYNKLMSDVSFNSGVMIASINGVETQVKGKFLFNYDEGTRFTATGVSQTYALRFIPEDSDNYNEYAYVAATADGKGNGFCLYLNVSKADISDGISVTLIKEYVYGELSAGFDINSLVADYDTSVYVKKPTDGTDVKYEYSTVKQDGFEPLAGSFSVTGISAIDKVPAGKYPVTFTINDDNYSGSKTVYLVVNKKKAEIIVKEEDKTVKFNNMNQNLKYTLVSDGEVISDTVAQSFYLNGVAISGAPSSIGKYLAKLNIRSTNYYADAVSTDFVIRVDEALINVSNTEQVYSVPRQVNAVIRLIDATYTLSYATKVSDDYYADVASDVRTYSDLPSDAGEYWILINFKAEENNGYEETIVYGKPLIIERYSTTISVNDTINVSYTGRSNTLRITTVPYGLEYKVEYKGENAEEYDETEILSANTDGKTHLIKITVLDANYSGEKIVLYRINPVALTEETAPVFNDYAYSDDVAPTVSTAGVMLFGSRQVSGVYSVDIEDVKGLSVGIHRVNYSFSAIDSEGNPDNNFVPYGGTTEINVVRKQISADDIIIGEASGTYAYYDGQNHSVDTYVREGVIVNPSANGDFAIKMYYNGQTSLPKEPRTYTVRAEISSKNYTGTKVWEKVFTIEKGTPVISVVPTAAVGRYDVGDTFLPNALADGTGVAVIDGTNTVVRGTFVAEEKTFLKANVNDVTVVFTPYDTAHFNSVSFTIKVNVTGENPFGNVDNYGDWNKDITVESGGTINLKAYYPGEARYGVKAGAFSIRVSGEASDVANINGFGVFSIADAEAVPDVNGTILVKFTPIGNNADRYNIVYGYLPVNVEKADLPDAEIEFAAYVGKALSEGKVIVKSAGKAVDIAGGTLNLYDGENLVDMTAVAENKTYTYVFTSNNYNDIKGEITVRAKAELLSDNIVAVFDAKNYDGNNITAADLGIKVINTETGITYENMYVTVYKDGVETDDSSQTGVYTVNVVVDNGVVRGEKSFAFAVRARDISSLMALDVYSATYGDVRAPKLLVNGTEVTDCSIVYKEEGASDAFFTKYTPDVAGSYVVKVSVEGENYYGEKEFIFTIMPRKLRIVADAVYSRDYGKATPPTISFKESDSETIVTVDYDVYYYSDSYSLGEKNVLPTAAGKYTARVVLDDANYSIGENGYAEFSYVINKLSVAIRTVPTVLSHTDGDTVYNIKYGQTAGEITLTGGEAKYGDETVTGIFRVTNGAFMPDAGDVVVGIEFIPADDNYATATENVRVIVAPADASVTFTDLSGAYTGITARNALTYTVSPSSVKVKIVFTNSYGQVVEPINAGGYNVVVTSLNENYKITSYNGTSGDSPVFVVAKAAVREVIDPVANEITVGDSLNKSALFASDGKGYVYYYGFNNPAEGRFEFIEKSLTYMQAGTYTAGYVFTPADPENFASYTGVTEVKVNRAAATIQVSNTEFTYSEGFRYPTFKTNPEGLKVTHDINFAEYDPTASDYIYKDSDIVNVGIYYFHVKIDDANYYSDEIEFSITINKKVIDLDFVANDGTDETVLQYRTTYGKLLDAKIKLYPTGTAGKSGYLLKDYVTDGVKLGSLYDIKYESTESSGTYNAHIPPSDIGTYKVTVSINDRNYSASGEIIYKIETGKIESIYFDTATMENQVYGAVTAPIVTTVPSGVSYYIIYQGYGMNVPKEAGSYHITVYFNDNNYEKTQSSAMFKINKKQLSVTNIQVEDKIYDGIPNINITGQLSGLVFGDEVSLKMSAVTANKETKVGSYGVEVVEYKLSGLQASNYNLEQPVYNGKVNIMSNKVEVAAANSFITSSAGFDVGTTVEFSTVNSEKYKTTFLEKVTGRDSKVVGYTVKVNGADSIIKNDFKVYLEIPSEFRNCDFEVEGVGKLEGQNVIFTREGDYITFNATSSGMVRFKKTEVKYGFVVIVAAVIIAVIGIIVLLIMNPLQNRRRVADDRAEKEAIRRIKQW